MILSGFIGILSQIETPQELWGAILDHAHKYGFTMVSYHHMDISLNGVSRDVEIQTDGYPAEWLCEYIDNNLSVIDPIPQVALATTDPFFWSDVASLADLTERNTDYLERLLEAGIGDGIAVQVFGPHTRNGYFGLGFGGEKQQMDQRRIREVQTALQAAHLLYCALVPRAVDMSPALSKRELEVMSLIARGKSNSEVAVALQVSRSTVDTLLKRVFVKLGVNDRITATVKAIGAGLIALPQEPAREMSRRSKLTLRNVP